MINDVYEKHREDALCEMQEGFKDWYEGYYPELLQHWVAYGNDTEDTEGFSDFARQIWKDFISTQ